MQDKYNRNINYLRVSLTDKCNLRCVYCMPEKGVTPLCHAQVLHNEEIVEIIKMASSLGIENIRLTGGEPLVRKNVAQLIENIKSIDGIKSVSMTTNATLLAGFAKSLKNAGLDRVNISLDTLDACQYRQITRKGNLSDALAGIDAALLYGFDPVKINVVVVKDLHQDLFEFAKMTLSRSLHVRFIEYMPIGDTANQIGCTWGKDQIIESSDVIKEISRRAKDELGSEVRALPENQIIGSGPAVYYKIDGALGTIGTISAISNHFCKTCNRIRLTCDGKLKSCLFSDVEIDIKEPLRAGDLHRARRVLQDAITSKPDCHNFKIGTARNMNQIGG